MKKAKEKGKKFINKVRHPRQASQQQQQAGPSQQPPQQAGPSQQPPQYLQAMQSSTLGKEDTSDLPAGGSPIPQNLHFFWKGESPGRENQEWPHLQQWGNMGEKSAGWNKTLWTDSPSINEWQENHRDKLKELEKMNVNVKPVEEEIDPKNKHVYDYAVNHNARTMASDVARYSVLKNHGGIYADLDIAPGNLSLPNYADQEGKEMLSSGRLPL
ncbi:glycosyltransferase [Pleurocapsa sp. FMAR1]|uniref:glycosyltransferase n=1 Tax=Pleurocapsa sp. FMAR1 TaxID=3040204 RepID=UPI0029C92EBC|nr:glycosyltransferase [Pleurocapsa sp. FMAR1]